MTCEETKENGYRKDNGEFNNRKEGNWYKDERYSDKDGWMNEVHMKRASGQILGKNALIVEF